MGKHKHKQRCTASRIFRVGNRHDIVGQTGVRQVLRIDVVFVDDFSEFFAVDLG